MWAMVTRWPAFYISRPSFKAALKKPPVNFACRCGRFAFWRKLGLSPAWGGLECPAAGEMLLYLHQRFAEALIMHDFPLAQEAQRINDAGVVA